MTHTTEVLGACPHDCPDTCALVSTVQDGRVIAVRGGEHHALTGGVLCRKVSMYPQRTYHPDRLLYPQIRVGPKGQGPAQFRRASWDEALGLVADRLGAIAADDPEAILPYSYAGTMGLVQGDSMGMRLMHHLGASRLHRSICASAGAEGIASSIGASLGMDARAFAEAELIVLWGTNTIVSNLHLWRQVKIAQSRGAYVVVIDPLPTQTARHADCHLAIRPGTDAALALAIGHWLIAHDQIDQDYLDAYTQDFEAYRQHVQAWTPERAAEVCGLPVAAICDLARRYGATRAAAIRLNYGMQRVRGGGQAVRAVCCLPALTGAWRLPTGGVLLSSSGSYPINHAALQRPDLLAGRTPRTLNMSTLGEVLALRERPVRALLVYNSNPVAVAPDSQSVVAGFCRPDLFTVVLEHFQTDTADYADVLLPATTQLEHWDIHRSYGHRDLLLNRPAIAPLGECLSNTEIFRRLARRMGIQADWVEDSDQDLIRQSMLWDHPAMRGFDWARFERQGVFALDNGHQGPTERSAPLRDGTTVWHPFAQGGFPTASGRFEFASESVRQRGQAALPSYVAPYESAETAPELARRYPLMMISAPARDFLNTTFANLTELQGKERVPLVLLSARDAEQRGLSTGQWVSVFNDRGSLQLRLQVEPLLQDGVIQVPSIWWRKLSPDGKNANELTHQRLTDLGEAPCFYDVLVEVRAC